MNSGLYNTHQANKNEGAERSRSELFSFSRISRKTVFISSALFEILFSMEAVIMGVTIGTGIIESLVDVALWELPVSEAALHVLRLT